MVPLIDLSIDHDPQRTYVLHVWSGGWLRHDMTLYTESGLGEILWSVMVRNKKQYAIYTDAAYLLRPWWQTAFQVNGSAAELTYNREMSAVQEAVEWTYKNFKQLWTLQDFKNALKVRQASITLLYKTSSLLWNFKTCLYSYGQTQLQFHVDLPRLGDVNL